MTFAEFAEKAGITMKLLERRFNIPYSTIMDWKSERTKCPECIVKMLCIIYNIE